MATDQFKHSIIVRPVDDGYVAEVPACMILKKALTAEQAVLAAQAALTEAYKNYSDLGITLPAEAPATTTREIGIRSQLQRTAINAGAIAVVLLVLLVPLSIALSTVYDRVEAVLERSRESVANLVTPRVLSDALISAADMLEQITPERRNEIVEALDRIVIQLEPYAEVVAPLLPGGLADVTPPTVANGNEKSRRE